MTKLKSLLAKGGLGALGLATLFLMTSAAHVSGAQAYVRVCNGKDAGDWKFGEAASGCNAGDFGDVQRANFVYRSLIFDRTSTQPEVARKLYMTNLHAVIRDAASSYFRRREPRATDAQVSTWVRAILATANQETYFSHYRIGKDDGLKLATGDRNRSHGMMQIYMKYHANRGGLDNSFDLMGNLLYGMELMYTNYQTARKLKCNGTMEKAIRGAYSIYNGGVGEGCRWTKARKRNRWWENDSGYYQKYSNRPWTEYVSNATAPAPVNVACLINGDDMCAVAETYTNQPLANRTLILQDGKMCLQGQGNHLNCVTSSRMFQCLPGYNAQVAAARPLRFTKPVAMQVALAGNRNTLCKMAAPSLIGVANFLKTTTKMRARTEIGGAVVGEVPAGKVYQVLDFEVRRNGDKVEKYYKVQFNAKRTAYIYGGDESDSAKWAVPDNGASAIATSLVLPKVGSTIEIVAKNGANLRVSPVSTAELERNVPKGTRLTVQAILIRESTNELYLRVNDGKEDSFMYAGQTYPAISINQWVKVIK